MRLIIVGCGQRGSNYAQYALDHPQLVEIVAIAEPNAARQDKMVQRYRLPQSMVFSDWKAIVGKPKFADAVVIATQDKLHSEPAVAFAAAGYHILLEKPMATSVLECHRIQEAVVKNSVMLSVCHVLRYTSLYRKVKTLLMEGTIGDVVSINHMENIGYWHFAHSFVRGNWRNEKESTFSLLAKSCHDIDLILYFMNGAAVKSVSSFGSLNHFVQSKKPIESKNAVKCLECPHEADCSFSAKKIYLDLWRSGVRGWPVDVITDVVNEENVMTALRFGPYGRCVYECDNDVVDNQVVSLQFAGGQTATFSMVAFTEDICVRKTRIFGTKGELVCDGHSIRVFQFKNNRVSTFRDFPQPSSKLSGHFYGDYFLMEAFVRAVTEHNPNLILSGPEETLHSHLLVFAAEFARRSGIVVDFDKFIKKCNSLETAFDDYNK